MRLFSNRSQRTSKCGKNKKVAHETIAECVTDVLLISLQNPEWTPAAFWFFAIFLLFLVASCYKNTSHSARMQTLAVPFAASRLISYRKFPFFHTILSCTRIATFLVSFLRRKLHWVLLLNYQPTFLLLLCFYNAYLELASLQWNIAENLLVWRH